MDDLSLSELRALQQRVAAAIAKKEVKVPPHTIDECKLYVQGIDAGAIQKARFTIITVMQNANIRSVRLFINEKARGTHTVGTVQLTCSADAAALKELLQRRMGKAGWTVDFYRCYTRTRTAASE